MQILKDKITKFILVIVLTAVAVGVFLSSGSKVKVNTSSPAESIGSHTSLQSYNQTQEKSFTLKSASVNLD